VLGSTDRIVLAGLAFAALAYTSLRLTHPGWFV